MTKTYRIFMEMSRTKEEQSAGCQMLGKGDRPREHQGEEPQGGEAHEAVPRALQASLFGVGDPGAEIAGRHRAAEGVEREERHSERAGAARGREAEHQQAGDGQRQGARHGGARAETALGGADQKSLDRQAGHAEQGQQEADLAGRLSVAVGRIDHGHTLAAGRPGSAGTPTPIAVDLAALDADSATPGDQAFSYIGTNAFSSVAGQLRLDAATSSKGQERT